MITIMTIATTMTSAIANMKMGVVMMRITNVTVMTGLMMSVKSRKINSLRNVVHGIVLIGLGNINAKGIEISALTVE